MNGRSRLNINPGCADTPALRPGSTRAAPGSAGLLRVLLSRRPGRSGAPGAGGLRAGTAHAGCCRRDPRRGEAGGAEPRLELQPAAAALPRSPPSSFIAPDRAGAAASAPRGELPPVRAHAHTDTERDTHGRQTRTDTHTHRARLAQPCTDTRGPRTPLAQLSRPLRAHTALARTACICTPARSPAPPRTHRTRCHAVPIPRSRPAWLSAPPVERSGPAERSSLSPGMGVREVSGGDNPAAQPPRAGRGCTEPSREGVTAAAPFRVRRGTDGLRSGCAAVLAGSPEGSAFPTAPRVSSQGGLSCLPRGRGTPRGWRDPAHGASPLPAGRAAAPGSAGGQWHLVAAAPHCTRRAQRRPPVQRPPVQPPPRAGRGGRAAGDGAAGDRPAGDGAAPHRRPDPSPAQPRCDPTHSTGSAHSPGSPGLGRQLPCRVPHT